MTQCIPSDSLLFWLPLWLIGGDRKVISTTPSRLGLGRKRELPARENLKTAETWPAETPILELQEVKDESEMLSLRGSSPSSSLPPRRIFDAGLDPWEIDLGAHKEEKKRFFLGRDGPAAFIAYTRRSSPAAFGFLYLDRRYNFIRKRENSPPSGLVGQ
ncbi:uncharacterized protein H6S33_006532 [Morchella sextelata]|uniref:uncharacterized protein n=1 Tax=Morchella sextelata TaxID=1174677 RepID=UPI001D038F6C|nr:uncharacterized protein H6S33_006532 [Morchella sextelata]KAH0604864.1 hypothetical protein H6S33_006532 [Morchella sextelata]